MLGYDELAAQLDAGVAPHHAGMVPAFKEAVEQCFVAGLLSVVFATETLAVGVNMPARTVVIEKLTKFTGDHHELLTPGEYTQLTGRAGRRGIDEVGQAVVLWSPFVSFDRVAALAGSRTFNLRSAFRPTYNMAANLVRVVQQRAGAPSPQPVVRPVSRPTATSCVSRLAPSGCGQASSLRGRRRRVATATSGNTALRAPPSARSTVGPIVSRRSPDCVRRRRSRQSRALSGPAVMVASASRKAGMRLTVISEDAEALLVTSDDVIGPVEPLGKVRLPGAFQPKDRQYRREVAKRLAKTSLRQAGRRHRRRSRPGVASRRARSRSSVSGYAPRPRRSATSVSWPRSPTAWRATTARSVASSTESSPCWSIVDTCSVPTADGR